MSCTEKRARLLLKRGRAVVHRVAPFTIRLKDRVGFWPTVRLGKQGKELMWLDLFLKSFWIAFFTGLVIGVTTSWINATRRKGGKGPCS